MGGEDTASLGGDKADSELWHFRATIGILPGMLWNIRIILVETSHPGNIGAVARAMKNMCLEQLCLVTPRHYPDAEATARASGADDLLARARVFTSLDAALEGCRLVIGTSARERNVAWPVLSPRESARQLVDEAATGPVALVFGRERSGLSNEELDRCNFLVHIPTNAAYSSLNLGRRFRCWPMKSILPGLRRRAVSR